MSVSLTAVLHMSIFCMQKTRFCHIKLQETSEIFVIYSEMKSNVSPKFGIFINLVNPVKLSCFERKHRTHDSHHNVFYFLPTFSAPNFHANATITSEPQKYPNLSLEN